MKTGNHQRPHVGIFGNTNQGKSTLINALTQQQTAIVSPLAGTTTDPVRKTMELFEVGPIVLIDTAGINDPTELGAQRNKKTQQVLEQVDLALLLISNNRIDPEELQLIQGFQDEQIPFAIIHGKNDLHPLETTFQEQLQSQHHVAVLAFHPQDERLISALAQLIAKTLPTSSYTSTGMLSGIVKPHDVILLVTPIDSEAPEGRLILPQVQAIRSILDEQASCIVLQDNELQYFLENKKIIPDLIITDSQVFGKVSKLVPPTIPLTSFSILLAHYKGDFECYLKGTPQLSQLHDGDRILIYESCTHQVSCEDIGRVKIPQWINAFSQKELTYDVVSGLDTPDRNFTDYALIIQCGACMITQNQLRRRIRKAAQQGVPITNYGMAIAYLHGIYDRVTAPFKIL